MRFPYLPPGAGLPTQLQRSQILDASRVRGAPTPPASPRDITVQAAPRGLLATWANPGGDPTGITGWRVYRGTDTTPYQVIKDRGVRQAFVETTAGQAQAVYVSSTDAFGNESPKVQVQGTAIAEAGAPTMPSPPTSFSAGSGLNTNSGQGSGTRNGNNRGGGNQV